MIPHKIWSTHDFVRLINILESTFPRLKKDRGWPKAKTFLYKWDSADPNGEFTHFSRDTEGKSIQGKENVYVGRILENSIYCMDSLGGLLTGLYEEHNIKTEIEQEMRSNMY